MLTKITLLYHKPMKSLSYDKKYTEYNTAVQSVLTQH